MRNQFPLDDKRNESGPVEDFLQKNAVEMMDEAMFDESPEEVIVYGDEGE